MTFVSNSDQVSDEQFDALIWERDFIKSKNDAVIAMCRKMGVYNVEYLQRVMKAIDQLPYCPVGGACTDEHGAKSCQRESANREELITELMKPLNSKSGWHQYYERAASANREHQTGLWFAHQVASCSYDLIKMEQILLAIMTSDLALLERTWPDLNDDFDCDGQIRHDTRDLVMDAIYLAFDPKIFAYLEQRIQFSRCSCLIKRYLTMAVQHSQLGVLSAILALDGVTPDIYRSITGTVDLFRIACSQCRGVTSLARPAYQIMTLVADFLAHSALISSTEMATILTDHITGSEGNDLLFQWYLDQSCHLALDPKLLIIHAWAIQNRGMLLFGMKQLRIQSDPSAPGLNAGWIASVLSQAGLEY